MMYEWKMYMTEWDLIVKCALKCFSDLKAIIVPFVLKVVSMKMHCIAFRVIILHTYFDVYDCKIKNIVCIINSIQKKNIIR